MTWIAPGVTLILIGFASWCAWKDGYRKGYDDGIRSNPRKY